MLTKFTCPDGQEIATATCAAGVCRMETEGGRRCMPIQLLRRMARVRPWTGKPTVTQVAAPGRAVVLERTINYAEAPPKMLWKLSPNHIHLGETQGVELLTETRFENEWFSGEPDCYDGGTLDLSDWKFCARYKAQMLRKNLLGEGMDYVEQLNAYTRLLTEYGFPVKTLTLWLFIRDLRYYEEKRVAEGIERLRGYVATGIDGRRKKDKSLPNALAEAEANPPMPSVLVLDVPMLDEAWYAKFCARAMALASHMWHGTLPDVCPEEARWGDKRCLDWCPGWTGCDYGVEVHAKNEGGKEDGE